MQLQRRNGAAASITATSTRWTSEETTFNLTVEECHNFFVGDMEVLVHNEGETGWLVYLGYAPSDTAFTTPIYVGMTNNLNATRIRHHADARENPFTYGYKQDMQLRPVRGLTDLTQDAARYNEALIYHQYRAQGIGNLQNANPPMNSQTMAELRSRYC
jgi:hypothetical protein